MNTSTSQKHNIVLKGGNDLIKAYVALGYMKQGSMFSDDQYYRRYNVRANLDLKPTKTTTVSADLGLVYDRKRTNSSSAEAAMLNIYRAKALRLTYTVTDYLPFNRLSVVVCTKQYMVVERNAMKTTIRI